MEEGRLHMCFRVISEWSRQTRVKVRGASAMLTIHRGEGPFLESPRHRTRFSPSAQ